MSTRVLEVIAGSFVNFFLLLSVNGQQRFAKSGKYYVRLTDVYDYDAPEGMAYDDDSRFLTPDMNIIASIEAGDEHDSLTQLVSEVVKPLDRKMSEEGLTVLEALASQKREEQRKSDKSDAEKSAKTGLGKWAYWNAIGFIVGEDSRDETKDIIFDSRSPQSLTTDEMVELAAFLDVTHEDVEAFAASEAASEDDKQALGDLDVGGLTASQFDKIKTVWDKDPGKARRLVELLK